MALYVLLLIISIPLVEIAVFIQAGDLIGIVPTILLTVATAFAGTVMLRQQGLSLVMRMQRDLNAGVRPEEDIMHGALIVLAALLLLVPGFVTDACGLLLFVPPARAAVARFIMTRARFTVVHPGGAPRQNQSGVYDLDESEWSRNGSTEDDQSQSPDDKRLR